MKLFKTVVMKKCFVYSLAVALFTASLVSCNKVEEETLPVEGQEKEQEEVTTIEEQKKVETITFTLQNNPATKAILGDSDGKKYGEWEDGDKIGSIVAAKSTYGYSTVNAATNPVSFSVFCKGGFSVDDKINLWYPYSTTQSDPEDVSMSIPAEQYMYGDDYDFSAMPMVAEEITVTAGMVDGTEDHTTVDDPINFYNLGSLINFRVFAGSDYTTERVLSVAFNASGNIAGVFSMDMTAVDHNTESTLTISGNTGTTITTNVLPFTTVGTSSTPLDVYMVVAPGSYSGTVVVVTDAATYTYTISSEKEFIRSHVRSFGLQLDKAPAAGFSRVAHVKGSFAFDLSKVSYNSASETAASWVHGILSINAAKASASTATNNYMPPTRTSTRFYKNSSLSFTVGGSLQIEKVVYTATEDSYATALVSSTWTNAKATAAGSIVTIVPTDGSANFSATAVGGTTGATEVMVFYDNNDYTITKATGLEGGSIAITGDVTEAKVNTRIELEATPEVGYSFTSWSVTDANDNAVPVDGDSFQMPASNVTVSATFTPSADAKTITKADTSHGSFVTDPDGSATPGATVTITATPDAYYEVESITVVDSDSNPVEVTGTTFTMPDKNVTVTVTFIYRPYEFTAGGWSSGYDTYTGKAGSSDYANSMTWTITCGGNVSSLGANKNSLSKCVLGDTYSKVGTPMSYTSSTQYVTAVITEATMANISKIVVTNSSTVGTINGVSLVYSTDNTTYYQEGSTLTSKTNGAYTFEFTKKAGATYYAIVFKGTKSSGSNGYFRIDGVNIKYYSK